MFTEKIHEQTQQETMGRLKKGGCSNEHPLGNITCDRPLPSS